MYCFFCGSKPNNTRKSLILSLGCYDFLPLVFSFLNKDDLCSVYLTCSCFAQIANSDIVWRPAAREYLIEQKHSPEFANVVMRINNVKLLLRNSAYNKRKIELKRKIEVEEQALAQRQSNANEAMSMIYYSAASYGGLLFCSDPIFVNTHNLERLQKELQSAEEKLAYSGSKTLESAIEEYTQKEKKIKSKL